jgi:hypothetical protein
MLENLIEKHKKQDVHEVVYRLSYAGKFVIVKNKTLSGGLFFIALGYPSYINKGSVPNLSDPLYKHFYDHVIENPGKRFTVRILAKKGRKTGHYELLKTEQKALDANRYNECCLNNATEAYIPLWSESKGKYGWLDKTAVMSFKRWLESNQRKLAVNKLELMKGKPQFKGKYIDLETLK